MILDKILCSACNGTGKIVITHWSFDGDSDRQIPDREDEEVCENCGGTGFEENEE